jgi:hypothetical protein
VLRFPCFVVLCGFSVCRCLLGRPLHSAPLFLLLLAAACCCLLPLPLARRTRITSPHHTATSENAMTGSARLQEGRRRAGEGE